MKQILLLVILLVGLNTAAQTSDDEAAAKKVITDFFEAFHKQDSVGLRNLAHPTIKMQSIGANAQGNTTLSTIIFGDFLKSIISIPPTTKFEEVLHSYEVHLNGPLAHVITPYTFRINDAISHCGVNSFTLVMEETEWKIVYLIDTRTKEGCDKL